MRKIKLPLQSFSGFFLPPAVRGAKRNYWSLILLAGFTWSSLISNLRAGQSGQEPTGTAQQTQTSRARTDEQTTPPSPQEVAAAREDSDLAQVQAELKAVHQPDAQAVAKALGIELAANANDPPDSTTSSLQDLGDLDGGGVPEFAFKQVPSAKDGAGDGANELPAWQLILLAWDGAQWRASRIKVGFESYELKVPSSLIPGSRQVALVEYSGAKAIPYPSIYRIKDHVAVLLWDGRSDDSLYQGFVQGRIEFRNSDEGATPVLIASGRADPGLLHFPRNSPRGFDVQTVYDWDGHGFVPKRTQYQENEDYRIYKFISALHLHDYRSAYALIDPAKFLEADAPTLDMFHKKIEASWPEFQDDQIFEIPAEMTSSSGNFGFELDVEDKHYDYIPSFGPGPKFLLTGLQRHESPRNEH
jgi:hypothetical protein